MLESRRRDIPLRMSKGSEKNEIGEASGKKPSGTMEPGEDAAAAVVTRDGEKESKMQQWDRQQRWWRQAVVNGAFFPLTLHYSTDGGLLGDRLVGLLGMVAGEVTLRQAWRETA